MRTELFEIEKYGNLVILRLLPSAKGKIDNMTECYRDEMYKLPALARTYRLLRLGRTVVLNTTNSCKLLDIFEDFETRCR